MGLQFETKEALKMLDTFASVGARTFDVTFRNLNGEKRGFRPAQTLAAIRASVGPLYLRAPERRNNIIIRPQPFQRFIQLDDLDAAAVEKVSPAAFLIVCTSRGNFQAWLAVEDLRPEDHEEFSRRVRKGAGADPTASGATRLAGSANFKPKYAPAFPIVTIAAAEPYKLTTRAELEALGIVAPPEAAPRYQAPPRVSGVGPRRWPSYAQTLAGARNTPKGEPDRSLADWVWCVTALNWGYSVDATAARLLQESEKAREQVRAGDRNYPHMTAERADRARRGLPLRGTQKPQI